MNCCGADGLAGEIAGKAASAGRARLREERLLSAAHRADGDVLQSDFLVPGMHCAGCMAKIEKRLNNLPFVENARANLSTRRVSVLWRENGGSASEIDQAITDAGYEHTPFDLGAVDPKAGQETGRRLLLSLAVAGFAAANIMLLSISVWAGADAATAQLFHLISGVIAIPAVAYAGQPFFGSAVSALRRGGLNMDVPISLAVLLALSMSLYESLTGGQEAYFDASVTLLFFLLIGRTLDHVMREKARGAVTRLMNFAAKGAAVVEADGSVRFAPLSEIEPGTRILIAAGERIPVDGKVVAGKSDLDRSLVTGESESVPVGKGAVIEAGTLNLTGPIEIEAIRSAEKSFLSEIIQMMEAAENGKAGYVRIADRMAAIYAPAVHILAALAFVGWLAATGDWHRAVYTAIAVLIVTCPCALGLAVPVVHVVGANRLFRDGVMIKDGAAFEKLAEITRVVFDKTGTLTLGRPGVTGVDGDASRHSGAIKALAARSHHPSAAAIARSEKIAGAPAIEIDGLTEYPGLGVEGAVDGKTVRLGRPEWVREIANGGNRAETGGSNSVTAFAVEGGEPVIFHLSDALRPGAGGAVAALKQAGLECEILSGDAEGPVDHVAAELGIANAAFGLTPKDKIALLADLQTRGEKVLMVGDGLNDAPSLAAAHVSIAPATGSDVGRLAADLVFTRESLLAVPLARNVAVKAGRLVRQNFALAILYNCIAVPLALAGYVTPLIAAIAMSASSIVVVSNSMRLSWLAGGAGTAEGGGARATGPKPENPFHRGREATA